jgi:two-component system, OmpR family, sensor histidine kinase MtrB
VADPTAVPTAGRPPFWRRLGIGARITSIFVLGALALSFSMGGLSYFTTRHFLVAERVSAAQHQAFANATLLRSTLSTVNKQSANPSNLLASLDAGSNSHSALIYNGKPYSSSLSLSASSIPTGLRNAVLGGSAATQTYREGAQSLPQIAVGVPIPSVHAAYFEVFSLSDLDHTLRVLGLALIAAGIVTTLLGAALGRFASDRSLRPLAGVSRAAVAIAGGQLDTRLKSDPADSDLVGLTTSFNAMVDELQVRIEREARFNSDVSHELRSPLTTLSASLEVLEADHDTLPPRAQSALQLLGEDLRRFQRMVGDLLEMSRADAGSVDVSLQEVNVCELVQRAVDAGMRSLGDETARPRVVLGEGVRSLRVDVDKRRFERVMANLLENAANYGGGATVVSVTAVATGHGGGGVLEGAAGNGAGTGAGGDHGGPGLGEVEIGVEDDGPGIEPLERSKVFERFFRGPVSGRRGTGTGSGLGLALVAEHVRLMHGRVRVEDAPSGGARFVIALPVATTDDASDGTDESNTSGAPDARDAPVGSDAPDGSEW